MWSPQGTGLASLILPEGLESIGEYAFERCSHLAWAVVPASVTRMGTGAFVGAACPAEVFAPGASVCRCGAC